MAPAALFHVRFRRFRLLACLMALLVAFLVEPQLQIVMEV
jgi:hypothetical protein